ncbi:tetratricopeptide repeat protein [Baaleninema simplex]|uniref:tetratricopeptide repeat protein n=1 Tax=Baaleninema simplex TaxID=2862350 RepID=UPI00034865FF|nr:tetratricopeptide repeat protein [Baaleninema simplex]
MMEQEWFDRGVQCIREGDYVSAIAALTTALNGDPTFALAYDRRGRAYFEAGRSHDAISDYTRALDLDPTLRSAWYGRAIVRLALKNFPGALADVDRALELDDSHAATHQLRGRICSKLADRRGAIESFKRAAQLYLDLKDKENCQRCLDRVRELQPPQPAKDAETPTLSPIPSVGDYYKELLDRVQKGDTRSVLQDLNWALQADENDARAYCCRGILYVKLGKTKDAIQDFNRALSLNPDDAFAYRNRGKARFQLGDRAGAMADFDRALELTPDDALAYVARGNSFRDAGEYSRAIQDYDRAIEIDGDAAPAYLNRATAYVRLEETRKAIEDYQTAASKFCQQEDWDNYHTTLEKLNQLQGGVPKSASTAANVPEDHLRQRLLMLVGGQWEIAERLIARAKLYYPNRSENWYIEKIVYDIERERGMEDR